MPRQHIKFLNENINILNQQKVKLEHNLQAKKNAIRTILMTDVRAVNLLTHEDSNGGIQNPNPLVPALQVPEHMVFAAVILVVSRKMLAVNCSWIKDYNYADSLNNGLKSSNSCIIFYSKNTAGEPDFQKPILGEFDELQSALYVANIYRYFGN